MFDPDLRRHAQKYYGKYSGEVMRVDDPDMFGRIWVKVSSIFGERQVQARPCFPPGQFFVPPVGARVWVEFEAGSLQHPIWVGIWYPQDTTPPEAQQDPPERRVIHTPSGHVVEFRDDEGEEAIIIRHKDNAFVSIDKTGSVIVSDKEGSHIYLNAADGQATMMNKDGHTLSLTADGVMAVHAAGNALISLADDKATVVAGTVQISGTTVALGAEAAEPTIMGTAFGQLWTLLATHTHATAMGPSGPPLPPLPPQLVPGVHLTSSVVVK